ncbi:MAG: PEGA domain-containing protein [Kofleriaceae bacterium]
MKRTQLITLLLVLFAWIGVAAAKPKVAVLGLEVVDKAAGIAGIDAARQITDGMRLAAKASGPYEIADNSQRELVDEKVINQCTNEARECLLRMAGNFGATALVYGHVGLSDNKKSFSVTVFLLTAEKSSSKPPVLAPVSASAQDLQSLGKKIYNELVGVTNLGSIAIKTNATKGLVYLNGDMRGQLSDGEHKATQLAEGEYKVRITADGFKKWEDTVKVKAGQTTTIEPTLEREAAVNPSDPGDPDKGDRVLNPDKLKLESRENTVSKGGGRGVWKGVAIGGAVVAAAGGAWWGYSAVRVSDLAAKTPKAARDLPRISLGVSCDASNSNLTDPGDIKNWQDGCRAAHNTNYGAIMVGVGGLAAIVGAYMGYIRGGSVESSSQATARSRKPRFAVTPIVAPDGGGATIRLDF